MSSRSCSPISRVRPGGGKPTPTRCGRHSRPTTNFCGTRSKRTTAGCSSYTGDGMCAVFASPKSAVDAAIAAQRALELPVRMGIATGEAELRGGDYFGAVLNRTARVMSAGHGGQILLDGATAGLLQRSRPDVVGTQGGYATSPNRSTSSKFKPRACATEFPPLEDRRSNTGKPAARRRRASIGREAELAELQDGAEGSTGW